MSARADTVGIVGAGPFGSALAAVVAGAGRRVVLWSRDAATVEAIKRDRSSPRLPATKLPALVEATTDVAALASAARFIVVAVASTDVRERALRLGDVLDGSHLVVHAIGALAPGVGQGDASERVSEVLLASLPTLRIGVLAGPALPADLAAGHFASMVVASAFREVVDEGRRLLGVRPALRVYGSRDLVGVELASALAGAYTIGLGISDGLRLGPGPRAVLVTRAVAEMGRLGAAAGAEARTFAGLAGLGNLLVRGASAEARSSDYLLGRRLAETGGTDARSTEGARATIAGLQLAKRLGVKTPVLGAIGDVLTGRTDAREATAAIAEAEAAEE
jgi:glycerol-3-phosphate dehydrogenase (NAD(P)+)